MPDAPYVDALRRASPSWGRCLGGAPEVSLSVVLDPGGKITSIERMDGAGAASACLEALIVKAKLPAASAGVNLLVVIAQ